jgi:hypothetical protein
MKHLMIISSMALGLALPALAQDQGAAPNAAKPDESIHAPTNRLDKLVPPMKGPNDAASPNTSSSSGAASGDPEHPPTNRIGKEVPDMKSPGAKSDLPSEQPAESK